MPPLSVGYGAVLAWAVWHGCLPWWCLPASFVVNVLAFWAYWLDKNAANQRLWRISERALHVWGLAGGWLGAWLAQQVLRHKSSKASFRAEYAFTVITHCTVLAVWLWWRAP